MESRQALLEEAWRNERKVNNLRSFFCIVIVVVGSIAQTIVLGRPHWGVVFVLAWGVSIGVLNGTWFRKSYHAAVPWLLSTIELVMVGVAMMSSRPLLLAARPDLADRQLGLMSVLLLLIVSLNMLRFSRRLSIFCTFLAIVVYLTVHGALGTLTPLALPEVLVMVAFGVLLVYTTARFGALLHRLSVDLRQMQRERIGSLRSLVAGVCHELNNPLGVLASNAQVSARSVEVLRKALADSAIDAMVKSNPKIERALAALEAISRGTAEATDRIGQTIGSLEGFARLDEAELQTVDIHQGIDEALALIAPRLVKIEVIKELAELPLVTCRPGELNQVFMHLLDNAAKSLPDGGKITISTSLAEGAVSIRISDTGKGIDRETLDGIFDPTFSSSGGRMKMGFGLSASQSIIHDHDGTIRIDSELGRGTTVDVRLPIASKTRS